MHCPDTTPRPDQIGIDQIEAFESMADVLIDARSPSEFAQDHIPGAINLPVLYDAERAQVGTLYARVSPFAAKRVGAAMVARNIAHHLETHFADRPKRYRPLIYCWRGGNRSGAFTHVLRAVGWNAVQLIGGYKAYRERVRRDLDTLPKRLRFIVITGPTGVGKSRFLRALRNAGAQTLDLESLAAHMGSVLGSHPEQPQPPQKWFESQLWQALRHFDPARPVFVESESRKIGRLHVPEALLARMRASECIALEAELPVRVTLLKEEYAHFLTNVTALSKRLDDLARLRGQATVDRWKTLIAQNDWDAFVGSLLVEHYDPAYRRSLSQNYPAAQHAPRLHLSNLDAQTLRELVHTALSITGA